MPAFSWTGTCLAKSSLYAEALALCLGIERAEKTAGVLEEFYWAMDAHSTRDETPLVMGRRLHVLLCAMDLNVRGQFLRAGGGLPSTGPQ